MSVHHQPPTGEDDGHLAWGELIDGRYVIERPLGHGGMGSVYLARDREFSRRVAIKVLALRYVGRPEREQRFDNEARYAGRLPLNENIATTLNAGRMPNGRPYIVMEHVEGPAINVLSIFEDRPLDLLRLLKLMQGVAEALCVMHRTGVVHRDLTPANILVTQVEGRSVAKVIDFSHAAADVPRLRLGDPRRLTGAHEVLGTAGYIPPEQVRNEPPDARMDVFSFGVVLWELLAGKPAFRHLETEEYFSLQTTHPTAPPPLGDLRPGLPSSLCRLVEDCTNVHIAARPAATSVVMRLEEIIEEVQASRPRSSPSQSGGRMPITAETLGPLPRPETPVEPLPRAQRGAPFLSTIPEDEPAPRRRPTVLVVLVVMTLVAVAVVLALWLRREDGTEDANLSTAGDRRSDTAVDPRPGVVEPGSTGTDPATEPSTGHVGTSTDGGSSGTTDDASAMGEADDEAAADETPTVKPPPRRVDRARSTPPRRNTKPTAPVRPERCAEVKAATEQARLKWDWNTVLTNVDADPACWPRTERRRLRVRALAELGRFEACVHEGSGSTDPVVVRQVEKCEGVSP